jgi:hypothetical protein
VPQIPELIGNAILAALHNNCAGPGRDRTRATVQSSARDF